MSKPGDGATTNPQPEQPPFAVSWRPAGPSDLRWEEKAEQLEFDELTRVRSAAEKWAASLTAILGLFGTVLLVKGREDITKLTGLFQVLVASTLLVALACGAVAVYFAALAAQGTPEKLLWPSGARLRKWEHEQALTAKDRLRTSRWLTAATVVLLALAVGLTWFGEAKPAESAGSNVLVVPTSGSPVCGKLERDTSKALRVRTAGGAAVTIAGGKVSTLTVVEDCP